MQALVPEPVNPDYEERKTQPEEPVQDPGVMDEESDPL